MGENQHRDRAEGEWGEEGVRREEEGEGYKIAGYLYCDWNTEFLYALLLQNSQEGHKGRLTGEDMEKMDGSKVKLKGEKTEEQIRLTSSRKTYH